MKNNLLEYGDKIVFVTKTGSTLHYTTQTSYIANDADWSKNYAILNNIESNDHIKFCTECYGYAPIKIGNMPECKPEDYKALTNLVREIAKYCSKCEVNGIPLSGVPIHTNDIPSLDKLIGLSDVKVQVQMLYNNLRIQQMRKKMGLKDIYVTHHFVFTGNPGTGKTTVARVLAQIYKDMGLLSRGHLIEVDRAGLVGAYIGHTEEKTKEVIHSALGGVLFIDEAYALMRDKSDSRDYGFHVIDLLVKAMEDYKGDLVVIVAGYPNEMNKFLDANPGLKSRFNTTINFPDYSCSELIDIFKSMLVTSDYTIDSKSEECLQGCFTEVLSKNDPTFGNGRYARTLLGKAVEAQSNRLASLLENKPKSIIDKFRSKTHEFTKEELMALTSDDIKEAYNKII